MNDGRLLNPHNRWNFAIFFLHDAHCVPRPHEIFFFHPRYISFIFPRIMCLGRGIKPPNEGTSEKKWCTSVVERVYRSHAYRELSPKKASPRPVFQYRAREFVRVRSIKSIFVHKGTLSNIRLLGFSVQNTLHRKIPTHLSPYCAVTLTKFQLMSTACEPCPALVARRRQNAKLMLTIFGKTYLVPVFGCQLPVFGHLSRFKSEKSQRKQCSHKP